MRKINFALGEYYHVYNRGVDKRSIFIGQEDTARFMQSMVEFNTHGTIGSIYENSFNKDEKIKANPIVSFVAYCLNPNHYHFLVTPLKEKGLETFMQRLGTGYTLYFNNRHKRSGSLFQGTFKATHVDTNEYLLHLSAYVNLNNKTHRLGGLASKLVKSSWKEYRASPNGGLCRKKIILGQFNNFSEYKNFASSSLADMIERKDREKELKNLLID